MKNFIKVTKGHLTQTEKIHLHAIFDVKRQQASINRKSYFLSKTEDENVFKVSVKEKYKAGFDTVSKTHTHNSEFNTNRDLNFIK